MFLQREFFSEFFQETEKKKKRGGRGGGVKDTVPDNNFQYLMVPPVISQKVRGWSNFW